VQLLPSDTLVLASDRPETVDAPDATPDYVGPVNPTSVTLAKLCVRRPVGSALDLGTGCGVQALLMSEFAQQVVATDVNPRALHYLAFNALLNGVTNVEPREGSFFEPVAGERFDLIASNPPFVVSPDSRYAFRDSGLSGDDVCREVVRGAGAALSEGGFATVLVNWVGRQREDWAVVPGHWLDGIGCDGWVLHNAAEDPLRYASVWNQLLRRSDPQAYAAALDRWGDYHAGLGAESLHYGAVILRRRTGANWAAFDELPAGSLYAAGEQVQRVFAAHDFTGSHRDEDLLRERFTLAGGHRLDQVARLADGEWSIENALLCLTEGIPFEGAVDAYTLQVLAACDGRRTLGGAFDEVATAAGIDHETFAETGLRLVRRLLQLGFLVRAD
jgi:Methyltransferase small domain